MLIQANVAAEWWGDAIITTASTTNCLPSLAKSQSSPMQFFLKIKPNPHFLRPFGCKTWALKPKANQEEKFDTISWDGTLIGYANDLSAYRILRHSDQKVINSRQVMFDETTFSVCPALRKSLGTMPARDDDSLPMFQSGAILPFEEEQDIPPCTAPTEEQDKEAVSEQPAEPSSRKRWVYIDSFQPEKPIESNINESNIIPGGRTRRQACFITSTIDPKSHGMAMNSPEQQNWIEAELKEINNMKKHHVWIE
jgi:hypothetical protein